MPPGGLGAENTAEITKREEDPARDVSKAKILRLSRRRKSSYADARVMAYSAPSASQTVLSAGSDVDHNWQFSWKTTEMYDLAGESEVTVNGQKLACFTSL